MNKEFPQRTHVYQNHHLDSTRWDGFSARDDDILICTSMKSGTTWMQRIVSLLIFQDREPPASFFELSAWIDMRLMPLDEIMPMVEAQDHRRFLKTHLALDGLPYFPQMKYLVVGRDTRDVFMSAWNHVSNYTDDFRDALNNVPGRVGEPLPPLHEDIHAFWKDWINRGNFPWESDGYPFWSHLHFAQTWWDYRDLPNICLIHFNDLLDNLEGGMRRVAKFLNIDVDESLWPQLVEQATFDSMKSNAETLSPGMNVIFKGGGKSFINKGTNGRWRDVLDEAELAEYDAAVKRTLSPECAQWLENGGNDC